MADKEYSDPTVEYADEDVTYDGGTVTRSAAVRLNEFFGWLEDLNPSAFIADHGSAGFTVGAAGPVSADPGFSAVHGTGLMFLSEDGLALDASGMISAPVDDTPITGFTMIWGSNLGFAGDGGHPENSVTPLGDSDSWDFDTDDHTDIYVLATEVVLDMKVTIDATTFDHWESDEPLYDGSTDNPLTVQVDHDFTVRAMYL